VTEIETETGDPARPVVEGPWFDEFGPGQRFAGAPAVTLTAGHAAVHQSIVGDRLGLVLDDRLARAVTGRSPLAHPALVWDIAIGQSTVATHHVKANLFYRGLTFHRLPAIGDTLCTVAEVVGLRQNQSRPGRAATGLVALRVTTRDDEDRLVLDFLRCAMIPLGDPDAQTGHRDDLDELVTTTAAGFGASVGDWDLAALRAAGSGADRDGLVEGAGWTVGGGDVVSSAPELARLALNVAKVHHDEESGGGRRLVYGGHTIGIAFAQVCRTLPDLVTVLGWHSCDHVGPVHEADTLHSRVTVERLEPAGGPAWYAHLRSEVSAGTGAAARPVLDWRFVALVLR
jgi:acyl dehydratase